MTIAETYMRLAQDTPVEHADTVLYRALAAFHAPDATQVEQQQLAGQMAAHAGGERP